MNKIFFHRRRAFRTPGNETKKEKKKTSDDSSDTDTENNENIADNGYIYVEKFGVSCVYLVRIWIAL